MTENTAPNLDDRPLWARDNCSHRVWVEDDSGTHDRERLAEAWQRLYGDDVTTLPLLGRYDAGDAFGYLRPGGRVEWHTCQGSEIREAHFIAIFDRRQFTVCRSVNS